MVIAESLWGNYTNVIVVNHTHLEVAGVCQSELEPGCVHSWDRWDCSRSTEYCVTGIIVKLYCKKHSFTYYSGQCAQQSL